MDGEDGRPPGTPLSDAETELVDWPNRGAHGQTALECLGGDYAPIAAADAATAGGASSSSLEAGQAAHDSDQNAHDLCNQVYQQMIREEHEHQSRIRSPSPLLSALSSESEIDGAQQKEAEEFDSHDLVRSFDCTAMMKAQQSLDERDTTVSVLVGEYIDRLRDFQASLQETGLPDHSSINATGIMQQTTIVEQVMHMAPFVQALQRKHEERQELAWTLVRCSNSPPPYHQDAQPDVLSAGEDLRREKQKA